MLEKMTNRTKKALETKALLLKTALDLFGEKGFDYVTINEIVEACGLSKGAFYNHFTSKYDVFIEKFNDIDSFYEEYEKTIDHTLLASEKIILAYEAQMLYLRDELGRDLIQTVYMSSLSHTIEENHYLVNPNRKIYKILEKYLDEGIASGEFDFEWTREEVLLNLTRCMRGCVFDWIIFNNRVDPVTEINLTVSMLFKGIAKK